MEAAVTHLANLHQLASICLSWAILTRCVSGGGGPPSDVQKLPQGEWGKALDTSKTRCPWRKTRTRPPGICNPGFWPRTHPRTPPCTPPRTPPRRPPLLEEPPPRRGAEAHQENGDHLTHLRRPGSHQAGGGSLQKAHPSSNTRSLQNLAAYEGPLWQPRGVPTSA